MDFKSLNEKLTDLVDELYKVTYLLTRQLVNLSTQRVLQRFQEFNKCVAVFLLHLLKDVL